MLGTPGTQHTTRSHCPQEVVSLLKKRLRADKPQKQWLAVILLQKVRAKCSVVRSAVMTTCDLCCCLSLQDVQLVRACTLMHGKLHGRANRTSHM